MNATIDASIFGKYLFINYGRLLKYTIINDDITWDKRGYNKGNEMIDLNVKFNSCSLITGIYKTMDPEIFQIVSKDMSENLLIILTWDCS